MRKLWPVTLILLLAAACGELPGTSPAHGPTAGAPRPSAPMPPTDTPIPYPLPPTVPYWLTPEAQPTAMAGPTPIVLGAEWAPESEREVYVSTTVVVAPVGDGPGQVGYYQPPEPERLPTQARYFAVDGRGDIYILDGLNQRVVHFDAQGRFVANIEYDGAVQSPGDLAVDGAGRVYVYDSGIGVKCFDPEGRLVREYPVPSWFWWNEILAMRVDEQGTLWVEGQGTYPSAPTVEGQPYPVVIVPLGNAIEAYQEEDQKASAIPGHLTASDKTLIVFSPPGNRGFVYDLRGQRVYESKVGVNSMDAAGNLYYVQETGVTKWNPRGRVIASFALSVGTTLIDGNGTVYCLALDRHTWAAYYVMRWQQK